MTTFDTPAALKERIEQLSDRRLYGAVTIREDTASYMSITSGMVLRLEDNDYFVTGDAKEGRFGIEDQPKFWVKFAVDLSDGARKILKLVFHERFTAQIGEFTVRCVRSPDKESRVLELVAGDPRFMQGRTIRDSAGNNVRVIDIIQGETLFNRVATLSQPHEAYYHEALPGILRRVAGCLDALGFLQQHGLHHGDVRNDHILIESSTGDYRWIDFDLEVNYLDYDIWSVGNILTYTVGKGIRTCKEAQRLHEGGGATPPVCADDALLFFKYRMANLRKVLPFVSPDLNELLMRFSANTTHFYEGFADIARDLREILDRRLL